MAEQLDETKAVSVTNISPTANEKTVSDFFSFCGKISKLFMNKNPDNSGAFSAVVQFETESAAKTALLLTNALIVVRPIIVVPFSGGQQPQQQQQQQPASDANNNANAQAPSSPALGSPVDQSNITQRDFNGVADEQRTKTSVIASMMAAGYVFSTNALEHAKEYDDKHNISLQAKVAVEQLKVKAHEIDQTYHISEKAQQVKTAVVEKGKQIDESYKLTEKAQQVKTSVTTTATSMAAKAAENPTVKTTLDNAKSMASTISASATSFWQDYKQQTQQAIAEKKKQQGQAAADSNPPTEQLIDLNVDDTLQTQAAAPANQSAQSNQPSQPAQQNHS